MKFLIAANWKMNKTCAQANDFLQNFFEQVGTIPDDRDVVVFPPVTAISTCVPFFSKNKNCLLGGQNFYPAEEGAFTGEVSAQMLKDAGCKIALVGHSERRAIFKENDNFLNEKVKAGIAAGLQVMLCIGETLEERESSKLESVLTHQLEQGLASVSQKDIPLLSVAYEPVWAIGTGKVAKNSDIIGAHAYIRQELIKLFGEAGNTIRILYGGSVKAENASDIVALDNVNGVLVGGASLQPETFLSITRA